jgi:hypothetical protein
MTQHPTQHPRWIARQGDVLLLEVSAIPPEALAHPRAPVRGRIVLASGEATGHAHTLAEGSVTAFGPSDDAFWLRVEEPGAAVVTHEEHGAIPIPERVRHVEVRARQREYSMAGERRVAD